MIQKNNRKIITFQPNEETVRILQFLGYLNKRNSANKPEKNLSKFLNNILIDKLQFGKGNNYELAVKYFKFELAQLQTEMDKFCEEKTKIMVAIAKEIEDLKLKQKEEEEKNDTKTVR